MHHDLAATVNGGRIVACSNRFYSDPSNVLAPGRSLVMSDGWETARRRDDGNDWLTVELAADGELSHAVIDTSRFVVSRRAMSSATSYSEYHAVAMGVMILAASSKPMLSGILTMLVAFVRGCDRMQPAT